MTKAAFLLRLREGLSGLPKEEMEGYLTDYGESIDDRMEEGLTEEEAVAALGSLEEIIAQARLDAHERPPAKKERRRVNGWIILLLILGFPVWGSLLVALVAVAFSLLAGLWSVVISLYAADVAVAVSAFGTLLISGFFLIQGEVASFLAALGTALVCAGLAIFLFLGSNLVARGMAYATSWCARTLWQGIAGRRKSE